MKKTRYLLSLMALGFASLPAASQPGTAPRVQTADGTLEGVVEASGVRAFKGVPFAAPPVGDLRWREPQPVKNWTGVRKAAAFGPRAMQRPVFGDMNFRSNGMSEDCLYLNVWTPAKTGREKLPVLVYFYGGGFIAGDGSEPRYDGESMAKRGIVALTVNYRLNVFGFMAHPELTAESPHKASGNYGLMDQMAALRWVRQNIAAFGGDPNRVTIAGESAGSVSVSAQMASPLSKNLFAAAIGESGSLLGTLSPVPLKKAEEAGASFGAELGAPTLAQLRAMPAEKLLEATGRPDLTFRFGTVLDGHFLPKSALAIFEAGDQARVPLLVGWNSEEMGARAVLGKEKPTPENYARAVEKLYGNKAAEVLKLYPGTTEEEILDAATDLAGDRFIGFSTWKWADLHGKTSGKPVYRYYYTRPRPAMVPEMGNATAGLAGGVVRTTDPNAPKAPAARGAVHSAEIEYAMGNLGSNKVYAWTPDDYKVSEQMQTYFANFVRTHNPNGGGLPTWPVANQGNSVQFLRIDVQPRAETETNRGRYLLMNDLILN